MRIIKVSGFEEKKKLSLKEDKRGLRRVSNLLLSKVIENERERVMLMGKFRKLRYEDLEEIYNDGCLIFWNKMNDEDFELRENGISYYLKKICWNVGMHYLRKLNNNMESLNMMMERGIEDFNGSNIGDLFEEVEDRKRSEEERYKKMDEIWKRLSEVDRMILESYYLDGCKMEDIAKRIGYKNGNSVKSRKNKVLKRIMEITKEEEMDFKDMSLAA